MLGLLDRPRYEQRKERTKALNTGKDDEGMKVNEEKKGFDLSLFS